ncbi:MAG: hypothetical protein Ct9H300mP25_11550 [Acidobacteriota bacterium]|nr:MAG: hypothetical protein Ct9H300mP25_11550 [Acidobacteriota bacterium]
MVCPSIRPNGVWESGVLRITDCLLINLDTLVDLPGLRFILLRFHTMLRNIGISYCHT